MPLDTDVMQAIMLEIDRGVPDDQSKQPHTPEYDRFRVRTREQIAAANVRGQHLHFTPEAVDTGPLPTG